MRVIVYVSCDVEAFNKAVKDGSAGGRIGKILEATKPEATYFTDRGGRRTAILILNLQDASEIPHMVEPWMLAFNAEIEMHPVMLPADLQKADWGAISRAWS